MRLLNHILKFCNILKILKFTKRFLSKYYSIFGKTIKNYDQIVILFLRNIISVFAVANTVGQWRLPYVYIFLLTDNTSLANPTMQGISIMRLYCAFKTITGFKFSQEESEQLIELITCVPPAKSDVSVRFVVVGLCTMVACSFLIRYDIVMYFVFV